MAQLNASHSNYLMGLLNQSPLKEMFPVLIRNIRAVVCGQIFTVKTRKSFETKL